MSKLSYLLIFIPCILFSQKNIENLNSVELLEKGIELHDSEKYTEAIAEYSKISVNDTNYGLAQYETALTYVALEEYKRAQEILEDLLTYDIEYYNRNEIYTLLGSAYDDDGQVEKAIETYNTGLKHFPKSAGLYLNRGITYQKAEKFNEAVESYQRAIECDPALASPHFKLGYLAANEGKYSMAMMSLITGILLEPVSQRARDAVTLLEQMSDGELEEESRGIAFEPDADDYSDLDLIFRNKIALEKRYKVKYTIETSYARQFDMFVKSVKYNPENENFWHQTYVPVYKAIESNKQLDYMILLTLLTVDNEKVQSKIIKKQAKVKAFIGEFHRTYKTSSETRFMEFEGKKQKVYADYNGSGLESVGKINAAGKPVGNWYYYYSNGALNLVAHFDETGAKTGKWEWFNKVNGNTSALVEFKDGELDGTGRYYYESGELEMKRTFRKGLAQDTTFTYYRSGDLLEFIIVKDDKRNGNTQSYFRNGQKENDYNYVDGLAQGPFKSYFANGQMENDFSLKDDEIEGEFLLYYDNGQLSAKINYKAGKRNGPYELYFKNGVLREKGEYKEDKTVGNFKKYYSNGKLSYTGEFDENGKENGVTTDYDLDGLKYLEYEYKKGELVQIRHFDKQGKLIKTIDKKGKNIRYDLIFPNGMKYVSGELKDDKRTGEWVYYDHYGNVSSRYNYKDGEVDGDAFTYFENGKVETKAEYEEGKKNGLYLEYNVFGELIVEGTYKDGQPEGEWYNYQNDGTLKLERYFVNGDLHGFYKEYAVNGKLDSWAEYDKGRDIEHLLMDTVENVAQRYGEYNGKVELKDPLNNYVYFSANYKNGEIDGPAVWTDFNGRKEVEGNFVNGYRNGPWKYYYPTGKLRQEMIYSFGDIEGTYKSYHENGKLSYEANYINGERQGLTRSFDENGKLEFESNYLDNERHGKTVYYGPGESIIMIRYYDQGKFVSYAYIGKDGKEVAPILITTGENTIVTYYPTGEKASEHKRTNGLVNGAYIYYAKNGTEIENETYEKGELHGKTVYHYTDGTTKSETDYRFGEKHGVEIVYYPNGKKKSETSYLYGEKHGPAKFYNQQGQLTSEEMWYNNTLINVTKI